MKTLLSIHADKNKVFDRSTKGNPIQLIGDTTSSTTENFIRLKKGYLDVGLLPDLEKTKTFTLEASIKPDKVTGARQNIMEAQSPAVALFIDKDGFVNGSVNIAGQGWKSVKSTALLQAARSSNVVFTKNAAGKLSLEINGKDAGSAGLRGDMAPVGNQGFKIGTWVDGKGYQFRGEIGNINIRSGAFTAKALSGRIKQAERIETKLKDKLGPNAHIFVNPSLDESHARLQPVKDVMNAAGIDSISDLSTLKISRPTVMTRGKVLIAPKKITTGPVNWGDLIGSFTTLNVAKKKEFLAKYLTNRNSLSLLKNATTSISPTAGTPLLSTRLTRRIDPFRGVRTGLHIPRELLSVNPTLESMKESIRLSDFVNLGSAGLTLYNKEDLIEKLESAEPEQLPQ
ncbi:MAG: LamG domain-containing protein, partial [Candidatus Electrothrix sp. EH2]|nr:LamG domain-containing protein [Candidatus Electrothrix sp. EH2]